MSNQKKHHMQRLRRAVNVTDPSSAVESSAGSSTPPSSATESPTSKPTPTTTQTTPTSTPSSSTPATTQPTSASPSSSHSDVHSTPPTSSNGPSSTSQASSTSETPQSTVSPTSSQSISSQSINSKSINSQSSQSLATTPLTTNSLPTTMSNSVGPTTGPSQTTPRFTQSGMSTIIYPGSGNTTSPGTGTTSKKGISGAVVFGIIVAVFAGLGAAFLALGFIRRRMRRARYRRRRRDTYIRPSILIQDEPAPVMGTRNAIALARANMGDSTLQMTEQQNGNNIQPTGRDEDRYSHGGVYDEYYNTLAEPEPAHIQYQHPSGYEGYDANGSPVVSPELTTSPTQMQDHQYADLSRALSTPPPTHSANVSPTSPFHDHVDSGPVHLPTWSNSSGHQSHGVERSHPTTYGSLDVQNPMPDLPTRTGTPVDPNPQQTYLTPGQDPFGSKRHPLRNVVSANEEHRGV